MKKVLVFAGTSEGRKLAEELAEQRIASIVSVATEYGHELMAEAVKASEYISVHTGRMQMTEMENFIKNSEVRVVVDATHPYATEVSENIKKACSNCGVELIRCLRAAYQENQTNISSNLVIVPSVEEAIAYLNTVSGNIFVTTGSKEIGKIAEQIDDTGRLYVRVLPNTESISLCEKAGIKGAKIYAMQGPFDAETNRLMLRLSHAKYMLTKESGRAGGFAEKLAAAEREQVTTVVISRPAEGGISFQETLVRVTELCSGEEQKDISAEIQREDENRLRKRQESPQKTDTIQLTLVGIGMAGNKKQLTGEAAQACEQAEVIFGAERILASLDWVKTQKVELYNADKIISYLIEHRTVRQAAAVFSGDTGFYSGAAAFMRIMGSDMQYMHTDNHGNNILFKLYILPGITTVQAFSAKLGIQWQDIELCSIHGRNAYLMNKIKHGGKLFSLAGSSEDIRQTAARLMKYDLGEVKMHVAVNLSYDDERIYTGEPEKFLDFSEKGLIAFILEKTGNHIPHFHLPDNFFTRGKVPMTKDEVRAVSVAKLMLKPDSILYDIGAGTGSVAVECANIIKDGTVYAIEKKPDAAVLIRKNASKAVCDNLFIIEGTAPQAFGELPAPTHAFIGGSSGNLSQILKQLYEKNRDIHIVVNAITLETQSEILAYIKEKNIKNADIVTMQVSRCEQVGDYHMMKGENPVMVVTLSVSAECIKI
ncbi:MAG: precorrin-6A reductase [Lachnospiraceae bacterium]|nr:precorrin-6A reductase [Lachnospiraceae bacterium]